jgi:hypothetical protein
MTLVILATASAALLAIGGSEVQIAANLLRGTQAQFLAEAGIEAAFSAFRATESLLDSPPAKLTDLAAPAAGPTLAAFGSYAVQYQAAGPDSVLVVSTGTSALGSAQKVLRVLITKGFNAQRAVLVDKNLVISGNPTILGSCGSAHTNSDLTISGGSVVIQQTATASGKVTSGKDSFTQPGSKEKVLAQGGQPSVAIPTIQASAVLEKAKADATASSALYKLAVDASGNPKVLQYNRSTKVFEDVPAGTASSMLKGPGNPTGWELADPPKPDQPARWVIGGSGSPPTGTFYVEGNITISGNPDPWTATLIAADTQPETSAKRGGNIVVSGNPGMSHHMTDTLLVADRDIQISGNPNYQGYILANEQIQLNGNPKIKGAIVAADKANKSDVVLITGDDINGNATIEFDCSGRPPVPGPVRILSWGL